MTIKDIIIKYTQEFKNISDTPRLDIEILIEQVLKVDRLYIHLNLNKEISKEDETELLKMVQQRLNNRPIAYIVENREFMGLDFYVKEGVLIPRPDTEILVEEIIEICDKSRELSLLDIGTGSGAITVSLAKYIQKSKITSFDVSDIALEVGKINAVQNEVNSKIEFIKSDLFTSIKNTGKKFDIIVSNPPYIPKKDIETLHNQVKDYEPMGALDGGEDGLDFYRDITEQSKEYLVKSGILAFEVGHDQAEEVEQIMIRNGYSKTYKKKDLQGIDRVVIGFNI